MLQFSWQLFWSCWQNWWLFNDGVSWLYPWVMMNQLGLFQMIFVLNLMQCRLQDLLDFDVPSVKYANTHLSELSPPAPLFHSKMVRITAQISQEMGTHSDGSCSSIKLVLDKSKPQPLGQIPQDSDYFILHFRLDLLNTISTVSSPPHKIVPFTACRDWQLRWAENEQVSWFCNPPLSVFNLTRLW